jgi:hypothetical protein
MNKYEHLSLPVYRGNIERSKNSGGSNPKIPEGRNKTEFSQKAVQNAEQLESDHDPKKGTN